MHPDQLTLDVGALGRRIAALRHESGLSQRRLAEVAGVSHGYIALLELGRLPSPGKFRLDAVARALNLRTADALTAPVLAPPFGEPHSGWPSPPTVPATSSGASGVTPPAGSSIGNVVGGLEQL